MSAHSSRLRGHVSGVERRTVIRPSREPRESLLCARDLMSTDVLVCQGTDSCEDVVERMREGNVGILPVMDGGSVVGVVTDRDIALRHFGRQGAARPHTTVRGCMTSQVVSVDSETSVEASVRAMRDNHVRRLLVMDGGTLRGVLTLDDVIVASDGRPALGSVVKEALRERVGPVPA